MQAKPYGSQTNRQHPGPSAPSWWIPRYETCAWCGKRATGAPCDARWHKEHDAHKK